MVAKTTNIVNLVSRLTLLFQVKFEIATHFLNISVSIVKPAFSGKMLKNAQSHLD